MSCSSANTSTGRNGKVFIYYSGAMTTIARITGWTVNPALATSNEWGDSDSGGYTNRSRGRLDATFTFAGKYDIATEVFDMFQPGDIAIVHLYIDSAGLIKWSFARALCSAFSLEVDVDAETVIGWTSDWGADGSFLYPGETVSSECTDE